MDSKCRSLYMINLKQIFVPESDGGRWNRQTHNQEAVQSERAFVSHDSAGAGRQHWTLCDVLHHDGESGTNAGGCVEALHHCSGCCCRVTFKVKPSRPAVGESHFLLCAVKMSLKPDFSCVHLFRLLWSNDGFYIRSVRNVWRCIICNFFCHQKND